MIGLAGGPISGTGLTAGRWEKVGEMTSDGASTPGIMEVPIKPGVYREFMVFFTGCHDTALGPIQDLNIALKSGAGGIDPWNYWRRSLLIDALGAITATVRGSGPVNKGHLIGLIEPPNASHDNFSIIRIVGNEHLGVVNYIAEVSANTELTHVTWGQTDATSGITIASMDLIKLYLDANDFEAGSKMIVMGARV